MPVYVFQTGETIALALDALSGDPATVSDVQAQLKAVPAGRTVPPPGAAVAATFDVAVRSAEGDTPPGWTLTIPAAESAQLSAGPYLADARLVVAGGVVITEAVALRLRSTVTT